jgi:hydrogenase-4 component E
MSTELLWALIGLGVAVVVVRRRTVGIGLVAAQSVLLGAAAIVDAVGDDFGLVVAGVVLVARGIVLPGLLLWVVRGTREPRRVASERFALPRLVLAVAAMVVAAALVPSFGLDQPGAEHAVAALVVLGIVIAAVRRPVVFQALGFVVAENAIYLAGLSVAGGIPAAIELALLFDVLAVLTVAAAFGSKIHEHFGTSDTSLLRELRD